MGRNDPTDRPALRPAGDAYRTFNFAPPKVREEPTPCLITAQGAIGCDGVWQCVAGRARTKFSLREAQWSALKLHGSESIAPQQNTNNIRRSAVSMALRPSEAAISQNGKPDTGVKDRGSNPGSNPRIGLQVDMKDTKSSKRPRRAASPRSRATVLQLASKVQAHGRPRDARRTKAKGKEKVAPATKQGLG